MKKHISLLLVLMLVLALPFRVLAAEYHVVDNADLLTSSEIEELTAHMEILYELYGYCTVIVTCDSLDGLHPESAADEYYDDLIGMDQDGVILLLAMETREWAICGYGVCYDLIDAQYIGDEILPDLGNGDYYDAFTLFLEILDEYFSEDPEINGSYDDYDDDYEDFYDDRHESNSRGYRFGHFLLALVIGAVAAAITIFIMRGKMNTARAQSGAASYLVSGSYQLTSRRDIYLYSRVSRSPRPKPQSSSGGGGGSSGGRSGGGGGGRASGRF